jgi:hypothetical protein
MVHRHGPAGSWDAALYSYYRVVHVWITETFWDFNSDDAMGRTGGERP